VAENTKLKLGSWIPKSELPNLLLGTALLSALFVIFHVVGNTVRLDEYGGSVFRWLVVAWSGSGPAIGGADYSHGFIIPLISLAAFWVVRKPYAEAPAKINLLGLFFLLCCLAVHIIAARVQLPRLSLLAFVGSLWSVALYLQGWARAKFLLFPIGYLLFALPLNIFGDQLASKLQLLMARGATILLNGLGLEVTRAGTQIFPPLGSGYEGFNVAAPCSGLRSLMALTALTTAYAWFALKRPIPRILLCLSSIPIAVIGNMIRVTTVALMADGVDPKFAGAEFHDLSGFIVFFVAVLLMVWLGRKLEFWEGSSA